MLTVNDSIIRHGLFSDDRVGSYTGKRRITMTCPRHVYRKFENLDAVVVNTYIIIILLRRRVPIQCIGRHMFYMSYGTEFIIPCIVYTFRYHPTRWNNSFPRIMRQCVYVLYYTCIPCTRMTCESYYFLVIWMLRRYTRRKVHRWKKKKTRPCPGRLGYWNDIYGSPSYTS